MQGHLPLIHILPSLTGLPSCINIRRQLQPRCRLMHVERHFGRVRYKQVGDERGESKPTEQCRPHGNLLSAQLQTPGTHSPSCSHSVNSGKRLVIGTITCQLPLPKGTTLNVLNWALLDFDLCKSGLDDPDVDEVEYSISAPASCTLGPLDRSFKMVVICCAI